MYFIEKTTSLINGGTIMEFLKNRKLIWFSVSEKISGTDLDKISLIALKDPVRLYVLCDEKIVKNIPPVFSAFLIHYGECFCFVETFKSFKKKLMTDPEFFNLIYKQHHIIFDIPNKFRKMLKSAYEKRSWPMFIKKLISYIY